MKTSTPFKLSAMAIALTLTACGGDSSSSKGTFSALDNTKAGVSTINANGGAGKLIGGDGGYIKFAKYHSSTTLTVSVEGTPDTDFDTPDYEPNLGFNPMIVSSSVTVAPYSGSEELNDGDIYSVSGQLYRFDGTYNKDSEGNDITTSPRTAKPATRITGIQINEGATLTIASDSSTASVNLSNDMVNNGTLTTSNFEDSTDSAPNLYLYTYGYTGSGTINMAGQSAENPNGRYFRLYSSYIVNSGSMDVSGFNMSSSETDGAEGGDAGEVNLNADYFLINSGSLKANAGSSAVGRAGQPGNLDLEGYRLMVNSGTLSANGATGTVVASYSDADIYLTSEGTLINTGAIEAIGASATDADTGSTGGQGGDVYFNYEPDLWDPSLEDPRFVNTGSVNVNGGAPAGDFTGGEGGYISFGAYESEYGAEDVAQPVAVAISGNLSANGFGSSETYAGGEGGYINLDHYSYFASNGQTDIVGYEAINVTGGEAFRYGGDGGDIEIYGEGLSDASVVNIPIPAPSVDVVTNLNLNGGNATYSSIFDENEYGGEDYRGNGGRGGNFSVFTYTTQPQAQTDFEDADVTIDGNVSAIGGSATGFSTNANGARAGYSYVYATNNISLSGTWTLNGGSSNATGRDNTTEDENGATYFTGGKGGSIYMEVYDGDIVAKIDANLNAGTGANFAYEGGTILQMASGKTALEGDITATGGNADANLYNSVGGNGGQLFQYSSSDKHSMSEKKFTLTGGTGNSSGAEGGASQNLICVLGNCMSPDSYYDI